MTLILAAGRDPLDEVSGGHSAYVRSYARAARRAGYVPHLFCAAAEGGVVETPFGIVHRVATPVRPFRQVAAGLHAWWVVPAIVRFALEAEEERGPRSRRAARRHATLLHGFGVWGVIAVRAAEELRRAGRRAVAVVSSYTTYEEEARAAVEALGAGLYGAWHRRAARLRHAWVRLAVERWERHAYVGAERLLLNYRAVRRLVEASHGAAPRIQEIPYTCEAAFDPPGGAPAERAPAPPGVPLVVSVARHDPRKGLDVLLHALAALRGEGVELRTRLVGSGPLIEANRELAARLGLAGAVEICGAVPDVRPHLVAADVFVLPSRCEQSGSLAVIEALQHGKPVIASAVDGLVEDLTDGEDALLPPPGDAAALAGALRRCLADRGLRERLGRRGRATFEARFAPATVAAALAALYSELGLPADAPEAGG